MSRDEAEPASRMPGRGGCAAGGAGGTATGCLPAGAFALGGVAREPPVLARGLLAFAFGAVARELPAFAFGAVARELTLVGRFGLSAGFFALGFARGAWA